MNIYNPAFILTNSCKLPAGAKVLVGSVNGSGALTNGIQINSGVSAQPLTVMPTGTTFSGPAIITGHQTWQVLSYSASTYFKVLDSGGATICETELGHSYDQQYLRFTTDPEPVPVDMQHLGGESGDPGAPIIGSSLIFYAPNKDYFSCRGNSATLADSRKVLGLDITNSTVAIRSQRAVTLLGIDDWRITAYPQGLEITPGSHDVRLSVASPGQLICGPNNNQATRVAVKTDQRLQELVVDWSPGWFRSRRYVAVPCGDSTVGASCNLLLRFNPKAK